MSDWGDGYDKGQRGMLQAIKTAEEMGVLKERQRAINIIRQEQDHSEDKLRPFLDTLIDKILEGK